MIDNHPPRHASVGDLANPDRLDTHKQGKSSIIDWLLNKKKEVVFLTMDEQRVLIAHGEAPLTCNCGRKHGKEYYRKVKEQQERAQKYLQEEKAKAQDVDKVK